MSRVSLSGAITILRASLGAPKARSEDGRRQYVFWWSAAHPWSVTLTFDPDEGLQLTADTWSLDPMPCRDWPLLPAAKGLPADEALAAAVSWLESRGCTVGD